MAGLHKASVLRQVYYDSENGFGSINETFKQAKKILNTITYNDTKEFLEKQKSRQTKPYRGFNSYVAPNALHEIQVDISDFTASASANDGYRYAFVAVDIFTKFCHAVPIKDKRPEESVRAMKEVFDKIGVPEQIYHDNEGSWSSKEFIVLLNTKGVKQIITSSPPPFAERMVQTLKNMIHARLEGLELPREKWIDLLPNILKKYNNTKHSSTGMPPNEAKRDDNSIQMYLNMRQKAQYNRTYPRLSIDSLVRTYIKPHTFKKGYHSAWSHEAYKVIHVSKDGKQFLVNDGKRRVWNRHELLKVEAVEDKDG
jgi:hypothetical protein